MIRAIVISFCLLAFTFSSHAQLCPGGGVNFNSAILFDPGWIYGCTTGSSCNGGVNFDNRFSCEPTTSLDVCAPQPSCGVAVNNASDIWFKFYASLPNVVLSCIQNTSLVIGIQAFDGTGCGALTPIGCALAGGPSSGVQLPLNGLQPGKLYYFRIFGSSHSIPQRTGLYCFCGTSGVQATILPASLESLKAIVRTNKVELSFDTPAADDKGIYEIEHSADGVSFRSVFRLANAAPGSGKVVFVHSPENNAANYYRIRRSTANNLFHYSSVIKVSLQERTVQIRYDKLNHEIRVEAFKPTMVFISDISGRRLKTVSLSPGLHHISTAAFSSGLYLVHNNEDDQVHKVVISK